MCWCSRALLVVAAHATILNVHCCCPKLEHVSGVYVYKWRFFTFLTERAFTSRTAPLCALQVAEEAEETGKQYSTDGCVCIRRILFEPFWTKRNALDDRSAAATIAYRSRRRAILEPWRRVTVERTKLLLRTGLRQIAMCIFGKHNAFHTRSALRSLYSLQGVLYSEWLEF